MAVALSENRVLTVLGVTGNRFSLDRGVLGGDLDRTEAVVDVTQVRALALSPSGGVAVLAYDDGTLRGVDTRTWQAVWALRPGDSPAQAVALASDAGPVVAALADGSIRRYDLAGDKLDVTGSGTAVRGVAVTADGAVIVAGCADGTLLRWTSRDTGPPRIWRIAAAVTAVAVGGGGDRVLAAAGDGKVRVYDFAAGESIGFAAGDVPVAPPVSRPGRVASAVDEDVRFTVYRPKVLPPDVWSALLVFAHKTSLVEQPGGPPMDPSNQVEARARAHFGDSAAPPAGADARYELPRGTRLRIVPELPGIQCNPDEAVVEWWEPVHEVEFRIRAPRALAGSVIRGPVRIWCGALILAEVSVAIPVADGHQAEAAPLVADSAAPYQKIFASYSHEDLPLLASFTEAAYALGHTYLRDLITIRSGERWEPRLFEMIEEADIFQLFWSSNSMRSRHCRDEWEYALSLGRPSFVRPVYWERPLPQDLALGLPPESLRTLQFVPVRLFAPQPGDPQPGQQYGTPSPVAPAAPAAPAAPSPAAAAPEPPPSLAEKAPPRFDPGSPTGAWSPPQAARPPAPRPPLNRRGSGAARGGYRRPALVSALVLAVVIIAILIALHVFG